MKKRAILFIVISLILLGLKQDIINGQITMAPSLYSATDSLNSAPDALGIMQKALMEQLKALEISSDSLEYYMGVLNDKLKKMDMSFLIPDEIAKDYGNDFDRDHKNEIVELSGETKTRNIPISVEKSIPVLVIIINGEVNSGKTIIEIYNPNNNKLGSFKLQNNNKTNNQAVNNSINKTFKNPIIGEWKVRVESEKAFGSIIVTIIQKL